MSKETDGKFVYIAPKSAEVEINETKETYSINTVTLCAITENKEEEAELLGKLGIDAKQKSEE